jgi:hypothetical protein
MRMDDQLIAKRINVKPKYLILITSSAHIVPRTCACHIDMKMNMRVNQLRKVINMKKLSKTQSSSIGPAPNPRKNNQTVNLN